MQGLNITGNLTVDEIHKIREWNYERKKHLSFDEYMADIKKGAERVLKRMDELAKQTE